MKKPLPSVNSLRFIHGSSPSIAQWLRDILEDEKSPAKVLERADYALNGHGVESIALRKNGRLYYIEYVNLGDTYRTTLCLHPKGRFVVSSWGDLFERLERQGYKDVG